MAIQRAFTVGVHKRRPAVKIFWDYKFSPNVVFGTLEIYIYIYIYVYIYIVRPVVNEG